MKIKSLLTLLFFFFLYTNSTYAQVDRSIGRSVRQHTPKKNKEKKDFGEAWADYLNKELTLDGLQYAAVKTIMNDNKNSIEEISKKNVPMPEKREELRAITTKIDVQILRMLSKEQSEKYLKMQEERDRRALTN